MDALLLLLKATLLLSLPILAARLLRRAPAAVRHGLWTLTFAALLALPFLASALPALSVPIPARWGIAPRDVGDVGTPHAADAELLDAIDGDARAAASAGKSSASNGPAAALDTRAGGPPSASASSPGTSNEPRSDERFASAQFASSGSKATPRTGDKRLSESRAASAIGRNQAGVVGTAGTGDSRAARASWATVRMVLSMLWLVGTIAATIVLIVSLTRVWRLARTAEELTDPDWRQAADALGARLGVRRSARLLASDRVGTPMAAGVWRPLIFLPASAREWTAECRDVVLAHEIAHLAVRDPLRHLTARLAVACYWFHPLAWLAARQATMAREQACDEAVLALGTRPSAYAQVLLDLAESMTLATPAPAIGALPMVERSLLETRLMAILNADVRPGTGRRVLIPAIGVALLMLSVAAARPVARGASSQSSSSASTVSSGAVASTVPSAPTASSGASASPGDAVVGARATMATTATDATDAMGATGAMTASAATTTTVTAATAAAPAIATSGSTSVMAWSGTPTSASSTSTTVQADERRDWVCDWDTSRRSFNGNMSTSTDASGREVIREQIGKSNGARVMMTTVGNLRLCMVADDVSERWDPPSTWLDGTARVVMEARRGNAVQRFELRRQFGGGERISWRVGGAERPFDAAAEQWRDRMLETLDAIWELNMLRGRESTLRGEISTIYGQESTLRGQISTLQGEVSTMQGRISTIQGEESTLRGQISTIQGRVSSMQGAISSEQGAISSLQAMRYDSNTAAAQRTRLDERILQHEAAIKDIEAQIRAYDAAGKIAAVQRQIDTHNTRGKVADIEAQIRTFDLSSKVAAIERQITELDVRSKVAAIERQITALDVPRRSRELEQQRDAILKRLDSALGAIR